MKGMEGEGEYGRGDLGGRIVRLEEEDDDVGKLDRAERSGAERSRMEQNGAEWSGAERRREQSKAKKTKTKTKHSSTAKNERI